MSDKEKSMAIAAGGFSNYWIRGGMSREFFTGM